MLTLLFWTSCCLELETCQTHLPRLEDRREHFEVLGGQGLVTFYRAEARGRCFRQGPSSGKGSRRKGDGLGIVVIVLALEF